MRFSIFFISLAFILLRVGAPLTALASTTTHQVLAPAVLPSSFQHSSAGDKQDLLIIGQVAAKENDLLVYDDAEDEDASELFARKFRLIAREYPELALLDEPGCPVNRSKAAPSFFGRVTYRYLVQRVLRV